MGRRHRRDLESPQSSSRQAALTAGFHLSAFAQLAVREVTVRGHAEQANPARVLHLP